MDKFMIYKDNKNKIYDENTTSKVTRTQQTEMQNGAPGPFNKLK